VVKVPRVSWWRYRGAASPVADTQLEVTVRDGNTLVTKLRHVGGVCAQQRSNVTCLHREFLQRRTPPVRLVVDLLYNKLCKKICNKSTTNQEVEFDLSLFLINLNLLKLFQRHLSSSRVPLSEAMSRTHGRQQQVLRRTQRWSVRYTFAENKPQIKPFLRSQRPVADCVQQVILVCPEVRPQLRSLRPRMGF